MRIRKKSLAYVWTILTILMLLQPMVYAGSSGTSDGTATVSNEDPVVTSPTLTDTVPADKDGAQIDVWEEYWAKVNVADANKLVDLDTVTFIIWGPSSSEGGGDSESDHYTFTYTQSTDTWAEVGPGASDEHLVEGNCQDPADQQDTSGDFRLAFKTSKIAERTSSDTWTIKVIAEDDSAASDSDETLSFGLNFYTEMTVDDGTHAWASLSPGDNDILITTPGDFDIDITVTSNANFDLQAKGDGALSTNGYTIPLVNVEIHKDTLGSAVGLTTGYVDIVGLTNLAAGASTSHSCKLWISVPAAQEPGDYTYTLTIQVVEYTA